MRLVLFVEYDNGPECGWYTEVVPIEYSSKDSATLDLMQIEEDKKNEIKTYEELNTQWSKDRPPIFCKPYNGKNPRSLEKQKKLKAEITKTYEDWMAKAPWRPKYEITFCGHTMDLSYVDSWNILTLDEWYNEGS